MQIDFHLGVVIIRNILELDFSEVPRVCASLAEENREGFRESRHDQDLKIKGLVEGQIVPCGFLVEREICIVRNCIEVICHTFKHVNFWRLVQN